MPLFKSNYYATGKVLYALHSFTGATQLPTATKAQQKSFAKGTRLGTTTGVFWQAVEGKGRAWFQVNGGVQNWFVPGDLVSLTVGGKPVGQTSAPPTVSTKTEVVTQNDGVKLVHSIIFNDQQTAGNLASALYYRKKALAGGKVNAAQDAQLNTLVQRFNARQKKLKESTLLKVQTATSNIVKDWLDRAKSLISGPAVGVVPALAVPVWVIVAGAAVASAGAAYLAFKDDGARSTNDVLQSAHASKIYEAMTQEEKALVDQKIEEAGEAGKAEGKAEADNSLFGKIKDNILLVGGGILAFSYLNGRSRRK